MFYKVLIAMCSSILMAATSPQVSFQTSMGDFVVELNSEKAPISVENFLTYVKEGSYDNTIFHRVINGFMIQGGGFDADLNQKPTKAPIELESKNGLKNKKYSLAMARTSVPNSATSQFFINVTDNAMLDHPNPDGHGYAVFGDVIEGSDVIEAIKAVPTGVKNGMGDVPLTTVTIIKASIVTE